MNATPEQGINLNRPQVLYVYYLTAVLMDLVVLNLFAEFWDAVYIERFSISLLAAILLQAMLKASLVLEHRVGEHAHALGGPYLRIASAWAILFVSKLAILWVLHLVLGDALHFAGPMHVVVPFVVVVLAMLGTEEVMRLIYRRLA